jgi:hypothetical protein
MEEPVFLEKADWSSRAFEGLRRRSRKPPRRRAAIAAIAAPAVIPMMALFDGPDPCSGEEVVIGALNCAVA